MGYWERFFRHFSIGLKKATGEQMVGVVLALLILMAQIHWGVVSDAQVNGAWRSLLFPYMILLGLFIAWHLVKTPAELDAKMADSLEKTSMREIELLAKIDSIRPRIAFRATRQSADCWLCTQSLFMLSHIGGEAAQFVQIEPIQKGDEVLFFGQIDVLDSVRSEATLSFDLTPEIKKSESERIGKLVEFFGEEERNFVVSVNFIWKGDNTEDRVILNWNPSRMMLSTFPHSSPAYPATQLSDPIG